ncbi:hypothetical protein BDU57DRAFT_250426 [Ampelomyces quisqualis]|uniref:Uncharacterized protein n=1 Tax=Ampelomyces quisqualis TaxID=50730 RepID=A0A6A5QNJ6_AMPQU|nr:hypothetical protein BDU57DRAFT_250426 [Ampelomyces quisqualis]
MHIILSIAHLTTANIPQSIRLETAFFLARIAQRYDLNHLLIGYIDAWIRPHNNSITKIGCEQWLYIAWQFGLDVYYTKLANHLALHCQVDEHNALLKPGSEEAFTADDFPPRALFVIHATRTKHITALLDTLTHLITHLLGPSACKIPTSPAPDREICTARNNHGLQRYLVQHDLSPLHMHNRPVTRSVQEILDVLQSTKLSDVLRRAGDDAGHEACRVDDELGTRVNKVVEEFVWALDRGLVAQIKWNSARRGMSSGRGNLVNARLMENEDCYA